MLKMPRARLAECRAGINLGTGVGLLLALALELALASGTFDVSKCPRRWLVAQVPVHTRMSAPENADALSRCAAKPFTSQPTGLVKAAATKLTN